jgi:hypothetical protein
MQRVCCFCRSVYGEKCGTCGSTRVLKSLDIVLVTGKHMVAERWDCPDCKATWAPGSGRMTHGICATCLSLRRPVAA